MLLELKKIEELVIDLQTAIEGEVRFDNLTRQLYSTDASDFQQVPVGVVIPKTIEDICTTIKIADRYHVPIVPRGGGSSLSGQTVTTGLIIDHSKYLNKILKLNTTENWVEVEAGVVLDYLNAYLADYGLMVGPDPSSSAVATIGGMAGNNSTGSHSFKYRMIADHIHQLEVVLADGSRAVLDNKTKDEVTHLAKQNSAEGRLYKKIPSILKTYQKEIKTGYPNTWRNVAGYGLNRLFEKQLEEGLFNLSALVVGSEGTLAAITKIRLGLVPKPKKKHLLILHYDDLSSSLEKVSSILEHNPAAVELMSYPVLKAAHDHIVYNSYLKEFVNGLPGAILVVEFSGEDSEVLSKQAENLENELRENGFQNDIIHCITPEEVARVWNVRKDVLGLLVSSPGDSKPIWIIDDATVPVDAMVAYTEDVMKTGEKYGVTINFDAHAAAGCLHMGMDINLRTSAGLKKLEILTKEIMTIAIAHHGTTTGEHGEGLARSYFNKQLYGPKLHQAFKEVKAVFDEKNIFNPQKVVDAIEPWDTDWLKYHPDYQTPGAPKNTYFDYSYYGGYEKLVEMCNGQGTCRAIVNRNMCPSYQVTRDEKDSTRGRANALREAMTGNLGTDGLASQEVYEALELCLECKACRNECSSRVDMAKLKYEFLAQYHAKHGVPLRSRIFGLMSLSSAIGSHTPTLMNLIYQNGIFRELLDRTLKIDKRRELPLLAKETFRKWFKRHQNSVKNTRGPVVLWDDCHLTYHEPEIGVAATQILEAAGFEIQLVKNRQCCGRPLISKGLLGEARKAALQNVEKLVEYAQKGIPIIGVEPSCIACMRDEYPDLLNSEEARLVAENSFFFEEFITDLESKGELTIPFRENGPEKTIKVHTHCYQKAFGTAENVINMLKLIPLAIVEEIQSGCCGMAGSFGYEKEHYDLSMAIGEQALFPAIRESKPETIIAAAGTSCRQQIKDGTQKKALHPVVVLANALLK